VTTMALALRAAGFRTVVLVRTPVICPTGKCRFETRDRAERIVPRSHNGYRLFVYKCDLCGAWHLTKRPQFRGGKP
jgi:hypothetical protein